MADTELQLQKHLSPAKQSQLALAQYGARLILAAVAAMGRAPLTPRQMEELPHLRRLASKYEGRAIPIHVLFVRFKSSRVLPGLMMKGFARWELTQDGTPALVVKELGE